MSESVMREETDAEYIKKLPHGLRSSLVRALSIEHAPGEGQ